ncbi:MAG: cytochrome c, partial [Chloroflexi bacterium]|nr:cytochrome c [Chloroflexota bacterium]
WYFALLALIPSNVEDWFIIGFPLLLGLMFVLLPFLAPTGERSPRRRPWAVGFVAVFGVSVAALVSLGSAAPWSPDLTVSQLAPQTTQGLTGPAAQGAQLYQQRGCINCHAIAGVGGQRGPDLTRVGTRLSTDELTWRILNGGRNMPAFGTILTPDQTNDLVQFLSQQR